MENGMENQVATYDVGQVAPADLFSGPTGLEGMDRECIQIPYLKIAQEGTDQAKRMSSNKIEGLQTGMFFSPASRKIYGESFRCVILKFYRNFSVYEGEEMDAKWLGSISPAEFKKTIESAPGTKRVKSYTLDANGHRYVDNRNFVVLPFDSPDDGLLLLTMSSSNIKASKNLLSLANNLHAKKMLPDPKTGDMKETSVPAPIWSSVWALTTSFVENPPYSYYCISNVDRKGWVPTASAPFLRDLFESLQDTQIEQPYEEEIPTAAPPAPSPGVEAVKKVFDKQPTLAGSDEEQRF
jgi:hypothetical protein